MPIPLASGNSFKIESKTQPEPVPISKILTLLFLKNLTTLYINNSVSGLGISVEEFTKKFSLQNSFFPII